MADTENKSTACKPFRSKNLKECLQDISKGLDENFLNSFQACKTDRERFAHLWERKNVHEVLGPVDPNYTTKSLEASKQSRLEGNKLFQEKKYEEALEKFNESVLAAPWNKENKDDNVLALAFGNRSAALLYLRRYRECIQEIDQAIQHGYAKENIQKLYMRKGKCCILLKDQAGAKECQEKFLEALQFANLKEEEVEELKTSFAKRLEEAGDMPASKPLDTNDTTPLNIPSIRNKGTTYPNASDCYDVAYKPECGRYAVAKKDIRVGDVITAERPYASVLFPEKFKTKCQHCYKILDLMYPCPQCSTVAYCSSDCQKKSWDEYHHLECHYLGYLNATWMGYIGHISLRIALRMGCEKLLDFLSKIDEQDAAKNPLQYGINEKEVYDNAYSCVYHLVTNTEVRPMDSCFEFTVMAAILLKVLQQTDYFPKSVDCDKNHLTIGGVLLRHIQIVQCNGLSRDQVGVYPTMAMMNHSCDPAVDFYFYGDMAVSRAVKGIKAGKEITHEYIPIFHAMPKSERQLLTKFQYLFECNCEACEQEWPLMAQLAEYPPVFRCRSCSSALPPMEAMMALKNQKPAKCPKCNHEEDVNKNLLLLATSQKNTNSEAELAMEDGDFEKAASLLCSHMFVLEQILMPPWKDFYQCQESLKQCYTMINKKAMSK